MALERAVRERDDAWTRGHEFSAMTVELLHTNLLAALRIGGAKNVGRPIHIPRPWDGQKAAAKPTLKMGEFARMVKAGSRG